MGVYAISVRERWAEPCFSEWDEYYTAERTREMVDLGTWPVPFFNNKPALKKPPLQYMLGGFLMRAGVDPVISLRAVPFLYSVALALTMLALLAPPKGWSSTQKSLWRAVAFGLGFVLPVARYHATSAFLDMGQLLFIVLMLLCVRRLKQDTRYWYVLGAIAGMGAWQKSALLMALVYVVITLVAAGLQTFETRKGKVWLHASGGAAVLLLLALLIPVAYYLAEGIAFRDFFGTLVSEMSNRVGAAENHFWHNLDRLFDVFGWLFIPGSIALAWVLFSGWRNRDAGRLCLAVLVLLAVLMLFFSAKINHRYGLPVAVLCVLVSGLTTRDFLRDRSLRWNAAWVGVLLLCLVELNLRVGLRDFPNPYLAGIQATYEVTPFLNEVMAEKGNDTILVACYTAKTPPWPIISSETLLFHLDRIPEKRGLWYFIIPKETGARSPPIPQHCIGLIHQDDYPDFETLVSGTQIIHRHKHLIVWER